MLNRNRGRSGFTPMACGWQALRSRWRFGAVAAATTGLWLLAHLGDGWSRPLFLLPLGLLLSLAREQCGGLLASMALHFLNNAAVMALLVAIRH